MTEQSQALSHADARQGRKTLNYVFSLHKYNLSVVIKVVHYCKHLSGQQRRVWTARVPKSAQISSSGQMMQHRLQRRCYQFEPPCCPLKLLLLFTITSGEQMGRAPLGHQKVVNGAGGRGTSTERPVNSNYYSHRTEKLGSFIITFPSTCSHQARFLKSRIKVGHVR